MALIEDVSTALRVTSQAFMQYHNEISDLVEAAKADLHISGIDQLVETDPLIKRAVILYCKAHFGYDNKDADRLMVSYNLLRNHLAFSSDYHNYSVEEEEV